MEICTARVGLAGRDDWGGGGEGREAVWWERERRERDKEREQKTERE
jgi:hypothetical protein